MLARLYYATLTATALVLADPGFVALPVAKVAGNGTSANHSTLRTDKSVSSSLSPDYLSNTFYQYLVTFTIGSPPQQMQASLDTGSSDLWVYSSGAQYNYNHRKSSTAKYINSDFSIRYVDGSSAQGDYFEDVLNWGTTSVRAQFAVDNSYSSQNPYGVFGIALPTSEASRLEYDNYPFALKKAGLIATAAYSLYLDSVDSSSGLILFGAIDKSRYTGPLSVLPLDSVTAFMVKVSIYGWELEAILDAGTSYTYLPDDLVSTIANDLGASYRYDMGVYTSYIRWEGSVTYTFGQTNVTVPSSELWQYVDGQYLLTIVPYSESSYNVLLGDSFLRSAYVVYDLDHLSVGIAQASFDTAESDYHVIPAGGIGAMVLN